MLDSEFCGQNMLKASIFHSRVIFPELLCRYFTVGLHVDQTVEPICSNTDMFGNVTFSVEETVCTVGNTPKKQAKSKTLYCSCKGHDDGTQLICCDNDQCDIGWYHFSCVNIQVPPKKRRVIRNEFIRNSPTVSFINENYDSLRRITNKVLHGLMCFVI